MTHVRMERVAVRYPGGSTLAISGVDLEVRDGESLGLIGESGSGKTTIGRALLGLVRVSEGSIRLGDKILSDASGYLRSAESRRIQMVFQDASSSLNPRMTIHEAVLEGRRVRHRGRRLSRVDRDAVDELLVRVGIPDAWGARFPHELSGGQRQRVAIARAFAAEPEVVVLDEATSALDVSVQASILQLLKALREELGMTYIVIAHDLSVVTYLCSQSAVLLRGSVVEHGDTRQIMSNPQHAYTRLLKDSVPTVRTKKSE